MGFFSIFNKVLDSTDNILSWFSNDNEKRLIELEHESSRFSYNRDSLMNMAVKLFNRRKADVDTLLSVKSILSSIMNLPSWVLSDYNKSLDQIKDFLIAIEYENSPKKYAELTDITRRTSNYLTTGETIAKLGHKTAMSIATVVGTISTGTAQTSLTGVEATNAALVWLFGGSKAASGGIFGITAGNIVLGLFSSIGMTIAGLTAKDFFFSNINNNKLKEVEDQIGTIKHDNDCMEQKLDHLSKLISRSKKNRNKRLLASISWLEAVHPKDYNKWDENQKQELEKLINAVSITVQLINERI